MRCFFCFLVLISSVSAGADSRALFHFAVAQAYTQEGSYREAFESFREAVELEPEEPFLRIEFAELLMRIGRQDEAAEQARLATDLAPGNEDALRLLALVERRRMDKTPESQARAREVYAELHRLEPGDTDAAIVLGQMYLGQGQAAEAIEALTQTLELRPDSAMVVSLLAQALDATGDSAAAESRLREFLDRAPSYLRGRLALAELLNQKGDHAGAASVLSAAPSSNRGSIELERTLAVELFRAGELDSALAATESWLEAEPGSAGAGYLRSTILSALGRDTEAEETLRTVLEEHPSFVQAISLLADLMLRSGRPGDAVALLETKAALVAGEGSQTESDQLLLQLVEVHVRQGDWGGVLELTERLLTRPEVVGRAELALLRGQALAELDRHDEALERLGILRSDDGVASRATAAHAEVLHEVGRREEAIQSLRVLGSSRQIDDLMLAAQSLQRLELFDEAIPVLRRAQKLTPDSIQVLFWLAAAYEREGRRSAAEREFRRVLNIEPEFAPALNYLGYMWAERGENLGEAIDLVQRAVDLEPDNGAYVDSLGWAYYQLGRFEEARGHLERAARLVGEDSVVFEHLGDVYEAVGEADRALEQYRRALELDGENAETVRRKLIQLRDRL
ncbi:MAG: tetratricopeptide repeat protein [Acidobacteriota bacterium]|nr:tetratricopeptide repeat protein [Acidobacteriota bacterium]